MKLNIEYTSQDIKKIQDTILQYQDRFFVQTRIKRNVTGELPPPSQEEVWLTMSMCLLTSQQRSNPQSSISKFLLEKPFRLSLDRLQTADDVESFVQSEIKSFGGIRFGPRISGQMKENLHILKSGGWDRIGKFLLQLWEQRKQAPQPDHFRLEREAAQFISHTFGGFGPKQSRNFWQALGLFRYEFVLDSRVNKWLKQADFPIPLTPNSLGDEEFYCFLSDILRDLCIQAAVLPCVLDAAIFSSFDMQDWPEDASVW